MDIKEALHDAERERDLLAVERDRVVDEYDMKLEKLDAEIRGLTLAIGRHNGDSPDGRVSYFDWRATPRTVAVVELMATTGRPLSPSKMSDLFGELGRSESASDISQTLQYLKRKEPPVVRSLGRGKWVLVEPNTQLEG